MGVVGRRPPAVPGSGTWAGPRRVMAVFGTRPEAIKMLPVVTALRARPGVETLTCSTGQHAGMLDEVMEEAGERCDVALDLLAPGQGLSRLAARAIEGLAGVIEAARPDMVLVHGDTTTAFAGALAAFHARVPVGHVEAGLRSGSLDHPFPEEFNRRAVDAMAELLFAPTDGAAANLRGVAGKVVVTGNTGIDALLGATTRLAENAALREAADAALPRQQPGRRLVVATAHRRECQGPALEGICDALLALATRPDVQVAFPVHPNPAIAGPVTRRLSGRDNIHLLPPLPYLPMVRLLSRAALLLTDSGGLQEEAPALGLPVLVLREVTERPEALAAGAARLVGTCPARIVAEAARLLDHPGHHAAMARPVFPFGDGQAAERIAAAVEAWTPAGAVAG